MDLNRATILGRLTRDPEVKTTPTGKTVVNMGVATGRVWVDAGGNKQEKTEFHNCAIWGKLADIAAQYLTKGRKVYLEGRLETRNWVGKEDNVKHYRTEIVVDNLIMLDGPRGTASAQPARAASQDATPSMPSEVVEEEIKVEDIPF